MRVLPLLVAITAVVGPAHTVSAFLVSTQLQELGYAPTAESVSTLLRQAPPRAPPVKLAHISPIVRALLAVKNVLAARTPLRGLQAARLALPAALVR